MRCSTVAPRATRTTVGPLRPSVHEEAVRMFGGEHPQARDDLPPAEDLPVDPDLETGAEPRAPGRPSSSSAQSPRQTGILMAVALGGGLGSIARYGLSHAWPAPAGGFPWATFAVNISGSFALGLLMVYVLDVWPPYRYVRPFLGVGVLGGYTTFSTYAVETHHLLSGGNWSMADAYALTSLVVGLTAVWLGIAAARSAAGLPVRRGPSRRSQTPSAPAAAPATSPPRRPAPSREPR
ncbi:MAG TPA: fluoride efflux transporter CrcB [Streptomyces sp.]|nr:fluoride efflux transporter CrcB [Streptomyces sp.]